MRNLRGVPLICLYRRYDTEERSRDSIARRACRRHRLFGIGVGVIIDRLLIVRCKIGWFFFRRSTLTQDRSSLRDAIYGRIRLPNAHSLHWSITKAFGFFPVVSWNNDAYKPSLSEDSMSLVCIFYSFDLFILFAWQRKSLCNSLEDPLNLIEFLV